MDPTVNPLDSPRKPGERRGSSDEHGVARERRAGQRRQGERRQSSEGREPDRRTGKERRKEDRRGADQRRSGTDRRSIPERLNRVAAILLPRLLQPRQDEAPVLDRPPQKEKKD